MITEAFSETLELGLKKPDQIVVRLLLYLPLSDALIRTHILNNASGY